MKMNVKKQSPSKARLSKAMRKKTKATKAKVEKSPDDDGKNYISINKKSGVVYFGRIPHGFYEQEMRKYFSQFGKVKKTRVARSKKTGHSKGYGYVEFADVQVAKIVAETMNNYLMGNRLLKAVLVPSDKNYFAGRNWTEKKYPGVLNRKDEAQNKNRKLKNDKIEKIRQRKINRLNKIKERMLQNGIDWDLGLPSTNNSPSKVVDVVSENSSNSSGLKTESSNEEMSDENASSIEDSEEPEMESDASSNEDIDDDDDDMSSDEESEESDEEEEESDEEEDNYKSLKNKKNNIKKKVPKENFTKLLKRQTVGGVNKKRVNDNKQKLMTNSAFTKAAKEMVKSKGAELKRKAQLLKKQK